MRKVVYTCLFSDGNRKMDRPFVNNKDKLKGWDYIIFTNVNLEDFGDCGWTVIKKELANNHPIYTSRYYKWIVTSHLSEYDIGIYVDAYMAPANIDWDVYIDQLSVDNVDSQNSSNSLTPSLFKVEPQNLKISCSTPLFKVENGIIFKKHPVRNCIYDECIAIPKCGKDTKQNMDRVIEFLNSEGMPKGYGLGEGGLFIRDLRNEKVNNMCGELFLLMLRFTYRDQALLSYVFWKHGVKVNCQLTKDLCFISGTLGHHKYY